MTLALPVSHSAAKSATPFGADSTGPLAKRVMAFERATMLSELDLHNRNVTQTAKALGLERNHLYMKCQQLGIDLQSLPERE